MTTLSLPAPASAGLASRVGRIDAGWALERLAYAIFALFIFFTCFTFLRPSPYDFTALPAMALGILVGIRLHRSALVFVILLCAYQAALLLSLLPYLSEDDPTLWTVQSVYLTLTGLFFAVFFAVRTRRRVELGLRAYAASCLFAAIAGIISYSVDTGLFFTLDGRAAGVFEDPNVLGSFLILGLLYSLRDLLTGETRHPVLAVASGLVIALAIFLSFSRGSWAAAVVALGLMIAFTYRATGPGARRRIATLAVACVAFLAIGIGGLLTVGSILDRFEDRAQLTKDYDEGETGRFGNQLRSIPMLLEQPEGFGPLRFRLIFGLEPHNSYIGSFANGGWMGGLAFLGMVLATSFVGFRLCLTQSPYTRLAQIVWPALFVFFLQGLQIDIDHWRHVYIMLGMVWGLEAARRVWLAQGRLAPSVAENTVPV